MSNIKILRITTVASTMAVILKGQLNFLSKYFHVIGATAPLDHYFDEIQKQEGIQVYPVRLTRKITPMIDILALFQLINLIKKEKPDIVHSQTPKANLVAMLAATICRVPVKVISIVGMPNFNKTKLSGRILNILDKVPLRLANFIYPNSKGLMAYYEKNKYIKHKIKFIGNGSSNGLDFSFFDKSLITDEWLCEIREKYNISSGSFTFVFVGRIVNDKGIRELIDAFVEMSRIYHDKKIQLILVGPNRKNDDPLPLAYQDILRLNSGIISVGLQLDVRPFLALGDVFVFPSYREGLPGSLIQAAAMELPLIASNIIGNKEIVENVGGILFESKSMIDLLNAMKTVYESKEIRQNLVAHSRSRAFFAYNQNFYWNELKQEYIRLSKYLK